MSSFYSFSHYLSRCINYVLQVSLSHKMIGIVGNNLISIMSEHLIVILSNDLIATIIISDDILNMISLVSSINITIKELKIILFRISNLFNVVSFNQFISSLFIFHIFCCITFKIII